MLHGVDLGEAVARGKEDALNHIHEILYYPEALGGEDRAAHMARMEPEQKFNFVLSTEIFLSMRNNVAGIDPERVRQLLIDENREILSALPEGSQEAIGAIARASGRVTQINECIAAIRRVGETYGGDGDGEVVRRLNRLEKALRCAETASVKIVKDEKGALVLQEMGASLCEERKKASV